MIVFDGIVFNIQQMGGISVMFSEIIARMPRASYDLVGFRTPVPPLLAGSKYQYREPRTLERYRRAAFGTKGDVFCSTYYRLPADRRARVVTTVYDFNYERFGTFPTRQIHTTQKRIAVAGADRIICISENTRNDLIEFFGSRYADRCVVVPLAASDVFKPAAGMAVLPQVLFVGNRNASKNFAPLVEAMSGLNDLTLVCAGGAPFTDSERALLERHLRGRYRHTGRLDDAALNAEYNRSFCLVYPSLAEGFGIPVVEAMRAGCPVIGVKAASVPEVAGDAAILVERGVGDELRAAIESLRVAATRDEMIRRGFARSKAFSWDETYRRVVAVYEELQGRAIR